MNVYLYRDVLRSLGDQLVYDLLYRYAKIYGVYNSIEYYKILNNLKVQLFACNTHIEMLEAPYCRLDVAENIRVWRKI